MTSAISRPPTNNFHHHSNQYSGPASLDHYHKSKAAFYPTQVMEPTPPSNDGSPTDVKGNPYRQLYPPRQPLYVPAALRPTEFAARPTNIPNRPRAPDTPPASKDNSFDSYKSAPSAMENALRSRPVIQDEFTRGFNEAFEEGLESNLEEVSGPPTTAHWKPDVTVAACTTCKTTFTWFFRRHHCRHCGNIYCDEHSKKLVPLDHNARYHPEGRQSRACEPCYAQWKEIKRIRHSRASSLANSLVFQQEALQQRDPPIPTEPKKIKMRSPEGYALHGGSSMARSEGGMVWSTF